MCERGDGNIQAHLVDVLGPVPCMMSGGNEPKLRTVVALRRVQNHGGDPRISKKKKTERKTEERRKKDRKKEGKE